MVILLRVTLHCHFFYYLTPLALMESIFGCVVRVFSEGLIDKRGPGLIVSFTISKAEVLQYVKRVC